MLEKCARQPVSRVLSRPRTRMGEDGHSSGALVAERLMRPTRAAARRPARHLENSEMPAAPTWSCSRWGFPCRRRCRRRGALLPHRFTLAARSVSRGGPAVYFLWHYPWGRPRRGLPGTAPPWSPDFPLPARGGERPSGRLAGHTWATRTGVSSLIYRRPPEEPVHQDAAGDQRAPGRSLRAQILAQRNDTDQDDGDQLAIGDDRVAARPKARHAVGK